jgi:hypothetical protein
LAGQDIEYKLLNKKLFIKSNNSIQWRRLDPRTLLRAGIQWTENYGRFSMCNIFFFSQCVTFLLAETTTEKKCLCIFNLVRVIMRKIQKCGWWFVNILLQCNKYITRISKYIILYLVKILCTLISWFRCFSYAIQLWSICTCNLGQTEVSNKYQLLYRQISCKFFFFYFA